jgi:pyrroline-5-carboxylate reductase
MGQKFSLLLLGAGAMGGALLRAWLTADLLDCARSGIVDPNASDEIVALCARHNLPLNPEQDQPYDICVLAFKPQQMASILPGLRWPEIDKSLFVSVAAGTSLTAMAAHLKSVFPTPARIIRVMPNLPASIGEGASVMIANGEVSAEGKRAAEILMAASGVALWVDSEAALDSAMTISACGPAYLFLLAEALTEAGEALGLEPDLSKTLAIEMLAGSANLLRQSGQDPQVLREAVTSPGGTTAAALEILDGEAGLRALIDEALRAARDRAEELAD